MAILLEVNKGSDIDSVTYSADPVNLSTGNFIYDKTDLEIQGKNPFYMRRFYNAINDKKGVLGKDFNHNYEVNLTKNYKGMILHLEEGKEETFQAIEKGNYSSTYHSDGILMEHIAENLFLNYCTVSFGMVSSIGTFAVQGELDKTKD